MRRSELRGGANEYKISDILGPKFKQFVDLVENQKFERFLFKNAEDKATTGLNAPDKNDLHYDFSEYIMAASAAFRQIENPDLGKAEVVGQYGDIIYKIFDELISGNLTTGGRDPPKTPLDFIQLPYEYNNPSIKYLVPGFHLLSYSDKIYPNANGDPENALVNVIRYLHHFIALLELDTLDARQVITFLKGDNFYFMKYVKEVVDIFMATDYFAKSANLPANADIIREGVINGLTAVAVQIINKYKNIAPASSFKIPYDGIKTLDVTTGDINAQRNAIYGYFKTLGIANTQAAAIVDPIVAIDNMQQHGANAIKIAGLTPERLLKYTIDGLLNPFYILGQWKDKVVPTDLVQTGGDWKSKQTGGKNPPATPKVATTGPLLVRLPFLYGPVNTIPGANLGFQYVIFGTIQGDQATDAHIVTTKINLIAKTTMTDGVLPKIVDISASPNDNPARVVVLTLLNYLIVKNMKILDITPVRDEISDAMKKALVGYEKIATRLKRIPTDNFDKELAEFRESFVSEFTLSTGKYYTWDTANKQLGSVIGAPLPGQAAALPRGPVAKNNLQNPEIKDFYMKVVLQNPVFYNRFFNLVRTGPTAVGAAASGEVPINEAQAVSDADLANYRLNVRKETGYARLTGGQRGGLFGDAIFISLIPDYPTDGSVLNVWLSRTQMVTQAILQARDREAIRFIARSVYNSAPADVTVTIYGYPINLVQLAQRMATSGLFQLNYQDYFKSMLQSAMSGQTAPISKPTWKEGELKISEHMLRAASNWEREGNDFVRRNEKGDIIQQEAADSCGLIKESSRRCLDFFSQCFASNDANFPAACTDILNFNFDLNLPMTTLRDEIMKINPSIAFGMLNKLKFGSYLMEEEREPLRGFRRYKVQSVGSWLEELIAGTDRCAAPVAQQQNPCDPRPLREQLGGIADAIIAMARDNTKYPFFNYLDALVQWVNANPQVLNPEEIKNPTVGYNYPKINNSFRTYNYFNPYKPAEIRLRGVSCGLERLKSSILNELSGSNGSAMISTIANIPLGIEMPLARPGFVSAIPFNNMIPMHGGNIYDTEAELRNINSQFGYDMFYQIYQDLVNTMKSMKGDRKIGLTYDTQQNIQGKLDTFKTTEETLRKSLIGLIERNKLYQASRGYINPYDIVDDNKYAATLAKHSNLLNLSSAYNKKAINLIDLFQTIAKAVLGKLDDGVKSGPVVSTPGYERPMTADYRTSFGKKN